MFEGTLVNGTLNGTLTKGQIRGTAVGSLSDGQLELSTSDLVLSPPDLVPAFHGIRAGTLHLHR